MAQLFANNVSTKLATAIQSTDTSMVVVSSAGMPTLGAGDYFLLTLVGLTDGSETAWEIVKVTAVSGNTLTVVRAQEGTTANSWAVGTKVEARLTAGSVPVVDDAVTSTTKTWSSSKVSTELSGKAATSHTHTLSQITDFPAAVSATELGYLDGVTSAIQTQLNSKAATSHNHDTSNITSGTLPVARGGTGATTLTGILKGNGTGAFTTATAGTDYVTPSDTGTLSNKTIQAGTFTDGYTEETVTANTSTAYTINLANGSIQYLTLTGNCTYTFPTPAAGKSFVLFQKQDATGSRTVTWPASVKWPGGTAPTVTSTANKMDKFVFTAIDGTNWYGSVAGVNY